MIHLSFTVNLRVSNVFNIFQDNTGRHGCDAVLDVLSHVALDLQQVLFEKLTNYLIN